MNIVPPDSPRRIAVVVPKYGLPGGAEQFASALTERLARSTSYEFHVFAHRWHSEPDSPVHFHRLPEWRWPRFMRPWAFAMAVRRALRKKHFDLVHSHDRILRADIFSLHCTPHRLWVRDIRLKAPSSFDRSMIAVEQRMILDNPSATFLPVSSLTADLFRREYPGAKGRWEVMPPGVDYARFSAPDRETCRREICARHGIDPGAFIVLFVGMNFEHKGLDTVVTAVAEAKKQRSGTKFHLLAVGKGNVAKYEAQAARQGLESSTTFAGAITSNLERYYRAADCLMLPSAFETFGMVVLEAMAAGLPVIISPKMGVKDAVDHGRTGFILPAADDAKAGADYLTSLCVGDTASQSSAKAMAKASGLDWQKRAEDLASHYGAMLGKGC